VRAEQANVHYIWLKILSLFQSNAKKMIIIITRTIVVVIYVVLRRKFKCNVCEYMFYLRFQTSEIDNYYFTIYCNSCETKFNGHYYYYITNEQTTIKIVFEQDLFIEDITEESETIKNIENINLDAICISPDFPIINPNNNDNNSSAKSNLFTPFMIIFMLLRENDHEKYRNDIALILRSRKIIPYIEAIWQNAMSKQKDYLDKIIPILDNAYPELGIMSARETYSKFDNFDLRVSYLGISNSLTIKTLDKIIFDKPELYRKIIEIKNSIYSLRNKSNFIKMIKYFYEKMDIKEIYVQLNGVLKIANDLLIRLVPVYTTYYLDDIDEEWTFPTLDIEELLLFYEYSYEIMLDTYDFIMLLNNLNHRDEFDSFPTSKMSLKKIKGGEHGRISKGEKIKDWIEKGECFDWIYKGIFNNKIRNSIAHKDYKYDHKTQNIYFYDGSDEIEYSLLNFSKICIELIKHLLFLNEVIWFFIKIERIATDSNVS
jgi:hypothetical protein